MSSLFPQIGRYEIIREIARSNDIVYEAWDVTLNRRIALKQLNILPSLPVGVRDDRVARFKREARAAATINHPNIATVYEYFEDSGFHYIAMEYLEGQTLRDMIIQKKTFSESEIVAIVRQVLLGLSCAHMAKIVHRDIKPENLFIDTHRNVKIADFGIAKIDYEPSITVGDEVFGTPSYMSPEQLQGLKTDAKSDLWSVGVLLYELCTGYKPFEGNNVWDVSQKVINSEPNLDDVPSEKLRNIVVSLLVKDPEQRIKDANCVLVAFDSDDFHFPTSTSSSNMTGGASTVHTAIPKPQRQYNGLAVASVALVAVCAYLVGHYISLPKDNGAHPVSELTPSIATETQTGKTTPTHNDNSLPSSASIDALYSECLDRVSFAKLVFESKYADQTEVTKLQMIDNWCNVNIEDRYKLLTDIEKEKLNNMLMVAADQALSTIPKDSSDDIPDQSSRVASKTKDRRKDVTSPSETHKRSESYFTLGSSESDVLNIQGSPSSVYGSGGRKTLTYEFSTVRLSNGVVQEYSNISNNLKIEVHPSIMSNIKRFTIGSSEDDVLSVQGTPSSVYGSGGSKTLTYEFSTVRLRNGIVKEYSNISDNLKVELVPISRSNIKRFKIGSSRDVVLSVQGTPSSVYGSDGNETFSYEFSTVRFRSGVVQEYSNISGNLKIK